MTRLTCDLPKLLFLWAGLPDFMEIPNSILIFFAQNKTMLLETLSTCTTIYLSWRVTNMVRQSKELNTIQWIKKKSRFILFQCSHSAGFCFIYPKNVLVEQEYAQDTQIYIILRCDDHCAGWFGRVSFLQGVWHLIST